MSQYASPLSAAKHRQFFRIGSDSRNTLPTFGRDLAGQLLFNTEGLTRDKLPEGTQVLLAAEYLSVVQRWNMSFDELDSRLQKAIDRAPAQVKEHINQLYPGRRLKILPYIAFPKVENADLNLADDALLQVIRAIEAPSVDATKKQQAVEMLRGAGVYPIPRLKRFASTYHQPGSGKIEEGMAVTTIQTGWVRIGALLKKSLVEVSN